MPGASKGILKDRKLTPPANAGQVLCLARNHEPPLSPPGSIFTIDASPRNPELHYFRRHLGGHDEPADAVLPLDEPGFAGRG
jgi:hypothetical protein